MWVKSQLRMLKIKRVGNTSNIFVRNLDIRKSYTINNNEMKIFDVRSS